MRWRLIPPDPLEGGELPATEFVHPWPLLALAALAVNDHLLKGSGWLPGALTGKISDFAGLFFFPLLLTACADVLLYALNAVARRPLGDASLRAWKLALAAAFTGGLFGALKLSPAAARAYVGLLRQVDLLGLLPPPRVVADPSDLMALPMLALALWFGRRRLAEIPPARLSWLRPRLGTGAEAATRLAAGLRDCARAAGARGLPADLTQDLAAGLVALERGERDGAPVARARAALATWRSGRGASI